MPTDKGVKRDAKWVFIADEMVSEYREFCAMVTERSGLKPSWETFVAHKLGATAKEVDELRERVRLLESKMGE